MLLCAICFMFPMALVGCDQTPPPPTYYDVYFYNHDGVLISQKEVEDGKVAYCSTPTKSSDQYHIYEFDNWEDLDGSDATQDLTSVKNDMIVKATFNAKDNIRDIIKNSITLTINITTSPTIFRIIGGKTTSANYHFLWALFYNNFLIMSI